jgi:hypothetical protein
LRPKSIHIRSDLCFTIDREILCNQKCNTLKQKGKIQSKEKMSCIDGGLVASSQQDEPSACFDVPVHIYALRAQILAGLRNRTDKYLSKPSELDQWAQSVPLWQLLSDAMPRKKEVGDLSLYLYFRS